jgi:hypothetical protein
LTTLTKWSRIEKRSKPLTNERSNMEFKDIKTIEEGKQFLTETWRKGTTCPCCRQRVHLAPFKLEHGMTRGLVNLYWLDNKRDDGYFHVKEIEAWRNVYGGGKFAKCKFWEFIIPMANTDKKKRTSGMWAITEKGRQFVEGKITVPDHALLFNQKCYGLVGDECTIKDSLSRYFDYEELMGRN